MKHNLLNIGKIFDQGYTLMFDSQKCETGEEDSRRLVATTTRIPRS
jgi:hypothetical protein